MGYTHYYTKKRNHTKKEWNKFLDECKELHKNLPEDVLIADGDGNGEPVFNETLVRFNGAGDELSHETLQLDKRRSVGKFDFCKTNLKPYDLMVVAVLLSANRNLGYSFHSDGEFSDLRDGIKFYNKVTKNKVKKADVLKMLKQD